MTIPATHRLHYSYNPATRRHEDRHCPIRDIGSAADLAEVQRWFRGTREFDPVIHSTLEHYAAMLRPGEAAGAEHGWSFLDAGRRHGLGEPSSVAHSAMMLLALSAWHLPAAPRATANADTEGGAPALQQRRRQLMAHLAEGILHQQRADGSFRSGEVAPDELVFFANWQCQAGAAVLAAARARQRQQLQLQSTAAPGVPVEQVADYLRSLQRDIADSGFYHSIARAPEQQATVEVACALEGLAHCLEAASNGGDPEQEYAKHSQAAVDFLLSAQVAAGPGVPPDAVGGFGHSRRPGSGQRVDVTGHVACAFVKLLGLLE